MHRHTNVCAILTPCRKQSEKQRKTQKRNRRKKTRRQGSPAHAATLNDARRPACCEDCYSVRSTRIGSVDAARCAGRKQATSAAARRTHPTTANAETSSALTP
jgi:hypothetical protein